MMAIVESNNTQESELGKKVEILTKINLNSSSFTCSNEYPTIIGIQITLLLEGSYGRLLFFTQYMNTFTDIIASC